MSLLHKFCSFLFVSCIIVWKAAGQVHEGPAHSSNIRGEVIWEGKTRCDSLSVELVSGDRVLNRSAVMGDGTFELAGVQAGNYEIRIADPLETVLERRVIVVPGPVDGIQLKISNAASVRSTVGTVTRNRLLRKVPGAARKEFERGGKAALKGRTEESIEHLRKAVTIYPEYMEAHNDLGVRYLQLGRFEDAAVEFEAAARLDPGDASPFSNLALAWLALSRYGDAEFAARRALVLDPGFSCAQRVLRLVLARVAILPNPKPKELRPALHTN